MFDEVKPTWDKVILPKGPYEPESIVYYEGDIIKKHIFSTDKEYTEHQYHEKTRDRQYLLPQTSKGKIKKLTAAVLINSRSSIGVYSRITTDGSLSIASHTTQTTFYSSRWEWEIPQPEKPINDLVEEFINRVPHNYLAELEKFKIPKRKNVKYKTGDFFAFKINLTQYGFGRILLDVEQLLKEDVITKNHGLSMILFKPLLVKIYTHISESKAIDIDLLKNMPSLPSDYMMDNHIFYGEYEIIGNRKLEESEFDCPMSFLTFSLQWGLIHITKSIDSLDKYLIAENIFAPENSRQKTIGTPYGYNGVGLTPKYGALELNTAISNGIFDFEKSHKAKSYFDLRNPKNKEIRAEIMLAFGLDPAKSYQENCKITNTISFEEVLKH